MFRRKFRTLLAMLGVAVGVFSFLVMGSMAENFQQLSRQFKNLFADKVFISEKPTFWAGGGIISQYKLPEIQEIKGVKKTVPILINRFRTDNMITLGIPWVVIGVPPEQLSMASGNFRIHEGQAELNTDADAVMGFDIARENNLHPGNSINLEGYEFRINGIYSKTGGLLDGQVFISLNTAQKIYHRKGLLTSIMVIPTHRQDPEELSSIIANEIDGIKAIPPSKFKTQVNSSLRLWNSLASAALVSAVLAGALCIVIVMLVSISERTVEIGIKKATGASDGYIIAEFFSESFMIALAGWLAGSITAPIFIFLIEKNVELMGSSMFRLTGGLLLKAFLGAVIIGCIAGVYPAYKASKIKIVEAMKIRY
ncbi:MAG: ABC transporter permease [Vulcanimicrobiota bacterium]